MRSLRHWSLAYIINRTKELIYQKSHPDHPWLTKSANLFLQSFLRNSDIGLEFGSGRSTIWLAKRLAFLTSVEHDKFWYSKINYLLQKDHPSNVKYILCPENYEIMDQKIKYVKVADLFPDNSLDFVLIDGIYRDLCANAVLDKVRYGGILVVDNVNWYLPSHSISPDSRSISDGPASQEWGEFLFQVKSWRCIWTTSGVSDTAIYIKPCNE